MTPREPETPAQAHGLSVVVMGVSGCGKSTVAELLAAELGAHFKDGDELHPAENIRRMSDGIPLTDADRAPWLLKVRDYSRTHAQRHGCCVIACSALKQQYRSVLNEAGTVIYVHLVGSRELIRSRMHERTGHFMPETLLDSQFDALETPDHTERVVTVSIDASAQEVALRAAAALRAHPEFGTSVPSKSNHARA